MAPPNLDEAQKLICLHWIHGNLGMYNSGERLKERLPVLRDELRRETAYKGKEKDLELSVKRLAKQLQTCKKKPAFVIGIDNIERYEYIREWLKNKELQEVKDSKKDPVVIKDEPPDAEGDPPAHQVDAAGDSGDAEFGAGGLLGLLGPSPDRLIRKVVLEPIEYESGTEIEDGYLSDDEEPFYIYTDEHGDYNLVDPNDTGMALEAENAQEQDVDMDDFSGPNDSMDSSPPDEAPPPPPRNDNDIRFIVKVDCSLANEVETVNGERPMKRIAAGTMGALKFGVVEDDSSEHIAELERMRDVSLPAKTSNSTDTEIIEDSYTVRVKEEIPTTPLPPVANNVNLLIGGDRDGQRAMERFDPPQTDGASLGEQVQPMNYPGDTFSNADSTPEDIHLRGASPVVSVTPRRGTSIVLPRNNAFGRIPEIGEDDEFAMSHSPNTVASEERGWRRWFEERRAGNTAKKTRADRITDTPPGSATQGNSSMAPNSTTPSLPNPSISQETTPTKRDSSRGRPVASENMTDSSRVLRSGRSFSGGRPSIDPKKRIVDDATTRISSNTPENKGPALRSRGRTPVSREEERQRKLTQTAGTAIHTTPVTAGRKRGRTPVGLHRGNTPVATSPSKNTPVSLATLGRTIARNEKTTDVDTNRNSPAAYIRERSASPPKTTPQAHQTTGEEPKRRGRPPRPWGRSISKDPKANGAPVADQPSRTKSPLPPKTRGRTPRPPQTAGEETTTRKRTRSGGVPGTSPAPRGLNSAAPIATQVSKARSAIPTKTRGRTPQAPQTAEPRTPKRRGRTPNGQVPKRRGRSVACPPSQDSSADVREVFSHLKDHTLTEVLNHLASNLPQQQLAPISDCLKTLLEQESVSTAGKKAGSG